MSDDATLANEHRRPRLMELVAWLLRGPRMLVRVRPICPDHGSPMVTRKTIGDVSFFYCDCDDCPHSWKGNPERIV